MAAGLTGIASRASAATVKLEQGFLHPPADARPWVYWFWLNGNITSNGITADLEAMKRVGIGGVLIMEVDQGAPVGPVDFMSARWRELFRHVHSEASRLGLEVNMNDDAGWNGSGGPWIKPEQAMQEVVWSETNIVGPLRFVATLAQPPTVHGYYRDIAVQAFPSVSGPRIANIESKGSFQRRDLHKPGPTDPAWPTVIDRAAVTNLTALMDTRGRLTWEVPAGAWTIVRFGHTPTGVENAPAPATGRGLECDKLSREGIEANFAGMMAKLAADNGLVAADVSRRKPAAGKWRELTSAATGLETRVGLVATHIDSWENGAQNWTARMREEFRHRRGYDLLPWLPVLTGRVLGSAELSERFLWDVRQTVSELVIENYAGHFRELAHAHGRRFTCEAYGAPCDSIPYAGECDEPMGEFWTPSGALETCKAMASAAHVYGKRIVGAEAFTSGDRERWLEHPALLKAHGDRAFCEGINRFVFHRYALQPWAAERAPGMTMGPWGQHYERTQTWWEWTPAWHEYLARCQFMLRQGRFVADICYVQPEAPPHGPGNHRRDGYDRDECTTDAVVTRMSVKDGRIMLPDGMSYRVLALPWSQTMTPRLLRKVRELVEAGATVLGPRPSASPSLSDYPRCDEEVKRLAAELWGELGVPASAGPGAEPPKGGTPNTEPPRGGTTNEHRLGQGRVVWSDSPERVLREAGVPPDFTSGQSLRFIHRRDENTDIYFVANLEPWEFTTTCSFRVTGKVPELWGPMSGRRERAAVWETRDGLTHVSVPFEPSGSVCVVFRESSRGSDPIVSLKRDSNLLLCAAPQPPVKIVVTRARYGVLDDPARTRDVTAKVQRKADAGERSFPARMMAEGDDPAPQIVKTLAVEYTIEGRSYTVKARDPDTIDISRAATGATVEKARYGVLDDPKRTRDVREKLQRLLDAGAGQFQVAAMAQGDDPAFLVVKTLEFDLSRDGKRESFSGQDPDTIHLTPTAAPPRAEAALRCDTKGRVRLEAHSPAAYEWTTASGKAGRATVTATDAPIEIRGPWQVRFQPGRGAPTETTLDSLASLSAHADAGVKYFSGDATYRTTFRWPSARSGISNFKSQIHLDLGRVEIMARVKLNGKVLGTLWKPPFRVDVTGALQRGENRLEVRVVNLWVNRLIGDEQLPEDSERNPDGTLKQWPQWVLDGKPSPTGRFTFTSWRLWKKDEHLRESGLLGPVRLVATPQAPVRN
jgi:hypothetical protein